MVAAKEHVRVAVTLNVRDAKMDVLDVLADFCSGKARTMQEAGRIFSLLSSK